MNKAKPEKRKTLWWILGSIALLLILMLATRFLKKEEAIKVEVADTEIRTIYSRVTESGMIEPTIEVPMAPDVSGEVVGLYIKEGMKVKRGDLLVTIRPDNYEAALEQTQAAFNQTKAAHLQAQANVEQARATLLQDSVNLQRTRELYEQEVVSKVELENAELKYNVSLSQFNASKFNVQAAYYQMKSGEARIKEARQNLDRTNIRATMDGTVTMLNVELGQRVVGTSMMAGTELLKIADLSSMEVIVEISENDIVNLGLGDSARIEVDAFPDKDFYGKVSEIAYSASSSNLSSAADQVTNFEVKVNISPASYKKLSESSGEFPLAESPFRPGMTALVDIYTDKQVDALCVPIQSVTLSKKKKEEDTEEKEQEVVFLFKDEVAYEVPVTTGISDDSYIVITEGLEPDQKVVSGSYTVLTKVLKDSMAVEIDTGAGKKKRSWGKE